MDEVILYTLQNELLILEETDPINIKTNHTKISNSYIFFF